MKTLAPTAILCLALAAACGSEAASSGSAAPPPSDVPDHFHLAEAPSGALDVGAVHATAQDGQTVVVRGVVGGSVKPFIEGLAAFTIVDPALASCVGDGMDCPTPWDYCCVDPEMLMVSSATVELHDGGELLAARPRGFHGLDHLSTVVVQGTASRDAKGNLTIVATGMHPLQ